MLKFYYHPSPNPAKVALFLEESGLPYDVVPIDTRKGEQFSREYTAVNPNNKTPAIQDGAVRVFDSNAILLYLAEKTGKFVPEKTPAARAELLSWMMFIATGIGPYSGQAVHFKHFAPKGLDYAVDRYVYEARRHYGILDAQLGEGALRTRQPVHDRGYVCVGMGACVAVYLGRGCMERISAHQDLVRSHQ